MLNKRQCDFFDELCRQAGSYRTYEELAARLRVSTRSIRNYCAILTEFAAEVGAGTVLNLQPSGLVFCGSGEQIACIQAAIRGGGYYAYRLSQEERVLAIALLLLSARQALTVTQICDKLYVSRATVLSDMERARGFFHQFGVRISNNRGYRLSVLEQTRRDIVLSAIFPHLNGWDILGSRTSIIGSLLEDSFHLAALFPQLVSVLQQTERKYQISVNDNAFKQAMLAAALLLRRVTDGYTLHSFQPSRTVAENSSVLQIAGDVLAALLPRAAQTPEETQWLAQRFFLCRFDKLQSLTRSIDIHLNLELHRFLSDVEKELQCSLTDDAQLITMLSRHLQSISTRYSGGDRQSFEERLVEEYRPYYDAVARHIGRLEAAIGHACTSSEICSILLHIVSAIARKNRMRPRVCVVCHIGVGTAHFLAERLKEIFNLEITCVTAIHSLDDALRADRFDLIVSTVPLKVEGYPCVCISPNLGDTDILAVQAALAQIHKRRRTEQEYAVQTADAFSAPFCAEQIVTEEACADWREALRICGAPLLRAGAIREEYIEAVIRSVETNGPYFVFTPHVALAHAAPTDGVMRFCCSIYRPKTPVVFGHATNDPVQLVAMVGITDVKAQIGEISALMNLLSAPAVLAQLLAAPDAAAIAEILNRNLAKENKPC